MSYTSMDRPMPMSGYDWAILEAPIATPAVAGGEGWGRGGLLHPNLFSVLRHLCGNIVC